MKKSFLALGALATLFAANVLTGCTDESTIDNKNTLPANKTQKSESKNTDPKVISQDGDKNTVYKMESFKLDSAKGLVILNGTDIYQVDPMDYQTGGYWLQATEEMDLKSGQMHITGVAISKISDENEDKYITTDDVVKYPGRWKDRPHTEYRIAGRSEFDGNDRTKLWRVSPVPVIR